MFKSLARSPSAVDLCVEAIQRAILDGRLAPGTRLSPERRLAESFGVNRVTVRGALARVANEGLVSVRQGSGYRVRSYLRHGGPSLLGPLLEFARDEGRLQDGVADLLRVRRALAEVALEKLQTGVRPADRETIGLAIDRFADAVDERAETATLAAADLHILSVLVDATGSAVLSLCLNPITSVLASLPALQDALYSEPGDNLVGWKQLLDWLDSEEPLPIQTILVLLEARDRETLYRLKPTA